MKKNYSIENDNNCKVCASQREAKHNAKFPEIKKEQKLAAKFVPKQHILTFANKNTIHKKKKNSCR